jgi:serine/threonine-protein kinase
VRATDPDAGVPTYATATRTSDGNFVVAWSSRIDADSLDLFYRRFDPELKPLDDVVRVTDYVKINNIAPKVLQVKVVEHAGNLHFAYQWARGNDVHIRYIRVPSDTKAPGLPPLEKGEEQKARTLGEEVQLSPKTAVSSHPQIACDDTGCFVTWSQRRPVAAAVAFIDSETGKRQWFKPFSNSGRHPAVAIAPGGNMQLAWLENQRILTASLGRDGVGPSSKVARVVGERPPPMIAPGTKTGEWYVAWLDVEHNHLEPYVARMQCQ